MNETSLLLDLGRILGVGAIAVYTLLVLPERLPNYSTERKTKYLPIIAGGVGVLSLLFTLVYVGMGTDWSADDDSTMTGTFASHLGLSFVLILTVGWGVVSHNRQTTTLAILCGITLTTGLLILSQAWVSAVFLLLVSAILWPSWWRFRNRMHATSTESQVGSEPFLTCVIVTLFLLAIIGGTQTTLIEEAQRKVEADTARPTAPASQKNTQPATDLVPIVSLLSVCLIAVGAGSLVLWRTNRKTEPLPPAHTP